MLRRRILGRGLRLLLLFVVVAVALLYYLGSEKDDVIAEYALTPHVRTQQLFNLDIRLENTSNDEQEVVAFGLEQDLIDQGLQVVDSIPSFRSSENRARWTEYSFSFRNPLRLAPQSTDTLRIRLQANEVGHYQGQIVIWYNNQLQAQYVPVDFWVEAPPAWLGG